MGHTNCSTHYTITTAPIHFDTATEAELLGLQGVGGISANRIINYLKGHRSITKLQQLLELAPQLVVEQFQQFHRLGTWTSEIEEFRDVRPGNLSPKAVPDQKLTAAAKDQPETATNDQPEDLRRELLELKVNMDELRTEMRDSVDGLRAEMKADLRK